MMRVVGRKPGQPVTKNQHSPFPVRDTIAAGFPEIEAVSVALPGQMQTVREGQPVYVDELYVDPAFFDIFQLEFLRGSAKTALPNVNSLVETMDMREAQRSYEANLNVVTVTRSMLGRTLDILRG